MKEGFPSSIFNLWSFKEAAAMFIYVTNQREQQHTAESNDRHRALSRAILELILSYPYVFYFTELKILCALDCPVPVAS